MWGIFCEEFNYQEEATIKSIETYKLNMEKTLKDNTQRMLTAHINETEKLFNQVIKTYDKNGFAYILPSLDLGIPNNLTRLAGGFATGIAVLWNSAVPIIPIDTTVNICTSSVYEIDAAKYKDWFNDTNINAVNDKMKSIGAAVNFRNGNHFIQLFFSKNSQKYYLVLHGSSTYLKNSFYGLYPEKNNWYHNDIKTYQTSSGKYFRYIIEKTAEHFIWCARQLNHYNIEIHREYVKRLSIPVHSEVCMYHHYGMPSGNSVMMGTYFVKENSIVPLFTHYKCPVYLLKVTPAFPYIILEKEKRFLVPHGWGKQFKHPISEQSYLNTTKDSIELCINKQTKFQYHTDRDSLLNDLTVRTKEQTILSDPECLFGEDCIYDILYPFASYSCNSNHVEYFDQNLQ